MKTKLLLTSFSLVIIFQLNAQTFYYYNGKQVSLKADKSVINIITDNSTVSTIFQNLEVNYIDSTINQTFEKIKFTTVLDATQYSAIVSDLKRNPHIKKVCPYFVRSNATPIGTSDIFYVKLKNINNVTLLQTITQQNKVQIVKQVPYMPLWYVLSIQNSNFDNSIAASNYFYETGNFDDVDPAFMFNFRTNCVNDPLFNQQWGFYNSSNPSIDINICDAWNITRGGGINIAEVDQGIDRNHNDLSTNLHTLSFNAQSGTSPSVFINGNSHGTHVAGIIGAVRNNNLQVVGVAPEAKIMGVSDDLNIRSSLSAELASGISWAKNNGADIITNSWGDQGGLYYGTLHSTILEDAIIDAIDNGRGGKGCIVTFAAGNYASVIDYPANFYDGILTVGSITSNGSRSSFSGYGSRLDVVAPGSNILSTLPNNSTGYMNGTSMAAPHVAGVAALVLSVNSNLAGQQVRDIIENTAQKVGGYYYQTTSGRPNGIWNNEMGYGLIDAYAAVNAALVTTPLLSIIGDDILYTFQQATYSIPNLLPGTAITWSGTNNVNIISGQGTSQVTISICSGENATLTATLSGAINQVINKNITVNAGDFSVTKYLDHVEVGLYNPYAQCYDWEIDNSFASAIGNGNINCSAYSSISLFPQTLPDAIGHVSIRAKNGNCYSAWQGLDIHLWKPVIDGSASYLNPVRGEPFYACLISPPPVQNGEYVQYSWYIDDHLVGVTEEPCINSYNWTCGYSTGFYVVVSKDNEEVTSSPSDFWGMCSGGRSTSYISVSPNPATSAINVSIVQNKNAENTVDTTAAVKTNATSTQSLVSNSAGVTNMYLYDINTNQLVKKWNYRENSLTTYSLSVAGVKRGIYVLKMERDNIAFVTKVILQ